MLTADSVIAAYRLILGREPESEATIARWMSEPSIEQVGAQLLASTEFRRRLAYGMLQGAASQWVCAEIVHGLKIWVDLLDTGVAAGVLQGNWEPDVTGFILSILRPGDTFIDIGANVGWFTVLAARAVGASGSVHAFEPREDLSARLTASAEANGFADRCTVHACALGAEPGEMMLAAVPSEKNPGHSFLVSGDLPEGAAPIGRVPVRCLDSFTFQQPIRLIKLDVEGAEGLVLRGAGALLRRDHPIIVSEIFPRWLRDVSGQEPEDYLNLLKDAGYRIFHLHDAGIGREIHLFPRDATMGDGAYFNVVALAEPDLDSLLARPLDTRVASLEIALTDDVNAVRQAADRQIKLIRDALDQAHTDFAQYRNEMDTKYAALRDSVSLLSGERDKARAQRDEALSELGRLTTALSDTRRSSEQYRTESDRAIAVLQEDLAGKEQIAAGLRADLDELSKRIQTIQDSTFWRATGPARRLSSKLPGTLRANMARAARLAWWTVSLQLGTRLRERASRLSAIADEQPAVTTPGGAACASAPLLQVPDMISSQNPLPLGQTDRPVVMIIDDLWPEPDRNGGSIDTVNMITAMRLLGFDVIFAAAIGFTDTGPYRDAVAALGARCLGPADAPSVQSFIESSGGLVSLFVLTRYSAGGQYFELIRYNWPRAKIVFNTVDLHFLREEREARLLNDDQRLQAAADTRDREEFLVHGSDATIVVSATERSLLMASVPGANVVAMPLARSERPSETEFADRSDIGFIGGFNHLPNVDAVCYFLKEIWPLIRPRLPGCRFAIVGHGLPETIVRDLPPDADYLGHLPDIAPWFDRLRLSVAPLRYGAGMKGKVVSSLAAGLPCVGTPIAIEGMADLKLGQDILVGDTPDRFAEAVVRIYQDEALWTRLSASGQAYANRENSMAAYTRRMHELLIGLGLPCFTPP